MRILCFKIFINIAREIEAEQNFFNLHQYIIIYSILDIFVYYVHYVYIFAISNFS